MRPGLESGSAPRTLKSHGVSFWDPVLSENSAGRISGGVAAVLAEDATEAFVALDHSLASLSERQRDDVIETLVVAFVVVVIEVFTHDSSKVPFAHRHDFTQALGLDRPDEPLGVAVQVRASCWQAHELDVGRRQDGLEIVFGDRWPA